MKEMDLPPVVPDIKSILDQYVSHPERLAIHQFKSNLRTHQVDRGDLGTQLYSFHRTQLPLMQQVKRDPQSGKILGHEEVEITSVGETSKNSLSLTRTPGPRNESLKGNSTNYPFWPGGFEIEKSSEQYLQNRSTFIEDEEALSHELFEKDLLTCPPGLDQGVNFSTVKEVRGDEIKSDDILKGPSLQFWQGKDKIAFRMSNITINDHATTNNGLSKPLLKGLPEYPDELLITSQVSKPPVLKISTASSTPRSLVVMDWAEAVDISKPITDFAQRVPNMAFSWKFDLDNFQKQAIIHLEEHENVFVAAHTSAGKTVVAEYAIALSVRHMTRTIYTSPIKALSNQKFRDFKTNFESVGLVTGDVQINPTASCLIMTTEILRSMLYNGSDVIRDLEWVVFDEIHYLNNEERGHVWEEVLIMLPQHVSIIMLSATVPNALQFANWVGQIKRKKIFVISTSKRPVPLEHFLYTGSGGKSRNEQFLILDAAGNFSKKGYDDAKEAKESRLSKHQQQFGPKGNQRAGFNENSEKTTYIGLISHLKENDKLPVVIFTFSRNRIDTYSRMLSSVDLCTGAEKARIHMFFKASIAKLSEPDRMLPQVLFVEEMLKSGIGVHHSGILPILKEVVEMLFQKGLVKILFATETFAMGVNMPARTVVFDSCRKHDGTSFRNLNPAEYIQMAGRAGRRGLDTTGTVIILSKQGVPDTLELQAMMLGRAAKLESQFRVTYSMILNLLRVERLSVEDVLKRSFLEAGNEFKVEDQKERRKLTEEKLKENETVQTYENDAKFVEFYKDLKKYFQLRESVMDDIVTHPKIMNTLTAGRVIIVEALPAYTARLGIVLNSNAIKIGKIMRKNFNILILTGESSSTVAWEYEGLTVPDLSDLSSVLSNYNSDSLKRLFHQYVYYSHPNIIDFHPVPTYPSFPEHTIVQVFAESILEITDTYIQTDSRCIMDDIKKRKMERFKNDKPVSNFMYTLTSFHLLSIEVHQGKMIPRLLNLLTELHFKDPAVMVNMDKFMRIKKGVKLMAESFDKEKFKNQFHAVFRNMLLMDQLDHIDFMLSPESLKLHESYRCRIDVLQKMGYINHENLVQLKGRVACEMGNQNELMVTEMVLNNVLSDCKPEEIAALLSCMVFETKNVDEPKLTDTHLAGKVKEIKELAREIGITQRDCGLIEPVEQFVEQFKFGLIEVVYEWSKGKPFAEIMMLTEVQEGIIVRTIQRLDEMIRDVKDAARIIGDPSLKKKMEEASACIKRDIVFAASLYTQD